MGEIDLDLALLAVVVVIVLLVLAICDAGFWLVAGVLRLLHRITARRWRRRPPRVEVLPREAGPEVDELVIGHLRGRRPKGGARLH